MLLGVDVGGTFTDAVLLDGERLHTAKVPTTPDDQSRGVIAAVEEVLERAGAEPAEVEAFAHGMTVGTNALLEERGARTALVATAASPTCSRSAARTAPASTASARRSRRRWSTASCASRPPSGSAPRASSSRSRDGGGRAAGRASCARAAPSRSPICLLFSYLDPSHERRIAERAAATRCPDVHVSASHEVLPALPRVRALLDHRRSTPTSRPCSAATWAASPRPAGERGLPRAAGDAVLRRRRAEPPRRRGPAPGASSRARPAARSAPACSPEPRGDGDALGFDMGGTSCDVCVVEGGEVRRTDSREIDGPPDPAADGRRPHGRRRRRLDRLARRRRRAARRARARRAPSPGPPATAAAAPSRRSPTPTCCSATSPPTRELAGGVALDAERGASAAIAALGERARPRRARDRRGDRPGRQPGDGPGAARGHRRARRRPARLRAAALRRRRPDARRGDRRRARDRAHPLPARRRRPLGARPLASDRRRDTARTVMLARRRAQRRARSPPRSSELIASRCSRAWRAPSSRSSTSCATAARRSSCRCRGRPSPTRPSSPRTSRAEHEARYGYRDPEGAVELVDDPPAAGRAGPRAAPARRAGGRRLDRERSARSASTASGSRRRCCAASRPPGSRPTGPCVFELPEATLVLPPGWSASRRRGRARSRAEARR